MVSGLKNVTFTFENCDSITVDGKYIGYFLVDDLQTYFARIACNCIKKMERANTIAIEIHKDANVERYQFDQMFDPMEDEPKHMTFDRFEEWCDITAIDFELEDQYPEEGQIPCIEHYQYYVNWVGDSDYINNAQSTYISNDNNLYIVIAEGKKIEDFFDLEMIDDDEYMDFHWEMLMD